MLYKLLCLCYTISMKVQLFKICVNNKITRNIQIMDLYLYNKLRTDTLNSIILDIRNGRKTKSGIYVYAYKYKSRRKWCGVITNEHYTKEEYNTFVNTLKQKYRNLTICTLNGELLI